MAFKDKLEIATMKRLILKLVLLSVLAGVYAYADVNVYCPICSLQEHRCYIPYCACCP